LTKFVAVDSNLIPGIAIVVVLILVVWVLTMYNRMVQARNAADEAWSGIDVQLKRRRDLIPNLVAAVQGYAAHERQTLESVLEARVISEAASVGGPGQAVPAENALTATVGRLFAVAEQYPDLKASNNFLQLQNELASIESNIAGSRSIYNSNAREYNDRIQSFPVNLIAGPLGFNDRTYFETTVVERAVQPVNFA
jgi:LemA protein